MTPDAIAEQLAALRRAGDALRRRPARERLERLAGVLDGWRDAKSPWRRGLEAELPAATGFSPEVVREGLSRGLEPWSGDALRALHASELGAGEGGAGRVHCAFDTTAVLLAGAIPMPTLLSLLAPLALGSPVLAKTASRDPLTARWWQRSLAACDPALARCLAVVDFPGHDATRVEALLRADCVVATGSDETLAAVAARLPASRRFVGYGHRISLAVLLAPATRGAALEAAAVGLAVDVALWDQLGCLSPLAVYVVDAAPDATDRVAEALARALADAARRWPRGELPRRAAAAIAHERAEAQMRAAAGQRVAVYAGDDAAWTLVREADSAPRPAPLYRFVRVHPVADTGALLAALAPLGPHLAGVALAGAGSDSGSGADPGDGAAGALPRALARLGASRICPPGTLQAPPLAWPRDNRAVFGPLLRLADVEIGGA